MQQVKVANASQETLKGKYNTRQPLHYRQHYSPQHRLTLLECGGIIHSVTSDSYNLATELRILNNNELMGRGYTSEHKLLMGEDLIEAVFLLGVRQFQDLTDVVTLNNSSAAGVPYVLVDNANLFGDSLGGNRVITYTGTGYDGDVAMGTETPAVSG